MPEPLASAPSSGPTTPPGPAAVVTVVRAPACHLCDDALHTLDVLARRQPIVVEVVEIDSPRGVALVASHRPPMSPLVVLGDTFVSSGRLRPAHLLDVLRSHAAGGAGLPTGGAA